MTKRAHISWKTKYAAALLALGDVPYLHARQMHEDQIISLYHVDHNKLHAVEVDDHFSNLAPMLIGPHREKSKKDTGIAAKVKRLATAKAALETFLTTGEKPPRPTNARKIPARANPWPPKGSRPLRSRSSFERRAP